MKRSRFRLKRLNHLSEWTASHWEDVVLHALTLGVIICLIVLAIMIYQK